MKNVRRFRSALLVLPALALLVSSCSKETVDPSTAVKNLIAEREPAILVSLSVKGILDKGGISNYENIPLMARPLLDDRLNLFIKSEATGLNFSDKSYVLLYPGKPEPEVVMLAAVSNKEKVDAYMAEFADADPQENDGYSYIIDNGVIAWNEKLFILTRKQGSKDAQLKNVSELFEKAAKSDKKPHKVFLEALASKTDATMCMSMTQWSEMQTMNMEAFGSTEAMKEAAKKMKGCYTIASAAFENGKIVFKTKQHFTAVAKAEMNFYSDEALPESYKNYMGLTEPWAAFSMNMNFDKYYEKVMSGIPEMARMQMADQTGIDIMTDPQIKNLLGGVGAHVMISLSEGKGKLIGVTPTEENYMYIPTFVACIDLRGDLFKTVVDSALAAKRHKDGYYTLSSNENPGKNIYLLISGDDIAICTNNLDVITEIKTNGNLGASKSKLSEVMFKYPVAGFADFNQARPEAEKYDQGIAKALDDYRSLVYYGTNEEMILEINFKSTSKNGLWIFIRSIKNYFNDMMKNELTSGF